jgi:hypothetical protein
MNGIELEQYQNLKTNASYEMGANERRLIFLRIEIEENSLHEK